MTQEELSQIVERVVSMLVAGDYKGLETLSHGKRLPADEIAEAVSDYGARLVMPPPDAFSEIESIAVDHRLPPQWAVWFDLWTEADGQSDLTLELTIIEPKPGQFDVELDDLHVL